MEIVRSYEWTFVLFLAYSLICWGAILFPGRLVCLATDWDAMVWTQKPSKACPAVHSVLPRLPPSTCPCVLGRMRQEYRLPKRHHPPRQDFLRVAFPMSSLMMTLSKFSILDDGPLSLIHTALSDTSSLGSSHSLHLNCLSLLFLVQILLIHQSPGSHYHL